MSDEQKALVPQETLDKLVASESTLSIVLLPSAEAIETASANDIEAAREAYDAMSDEQKALVPQETLDKLVASESTLSIVLLPAIDDVAFDDNDAIQEAKAEYDLMSDDQKALLPQNIVDKLFVAETTVAIVRLPDETTITLEDGDAIAAARANYDALSIEQKALVPQSVVDTLVASETTLTIVILPDEADITVDNAEDLAAAREAYDAMTDEQKANVPQASKDKLIASEAVLTILELPVMDVIEVADKTDIVAARAAYEALNEDQKGRVPQAVLDNLVSSETVLTIVELPALESITLDDTVSIEAAREAYEALSDEQKALIPEATLTILVNAEKVLESVGKIDAIGEVEFTSDSKALIDEARAYYDSLTDEQKENFPESDLKILVDVEAAYSSMDAVDTIGTLENTEESKAKIEEARATYEALSDDQKALVDPDILKVLTDSEATFDAIDEINDIELKYSSDGKASIEQARAAREALSDDQKAMMPASVLAALVKAEEDYAAVDGEVKAISSIENIRHNESSREAIASARADYESLSEDQKQFFPQETLQELVNFETAFETLEKISFLSSGIKYDEESQAQIAKARKDYDAMSDEQKALIDPEDLATLTAAEEAYAKKDASARATYTSLLIIVSVLLVLSAVVLFWFFKHIKKSKGSGAKTYSIALLPILIAASHYLDAPFIALYVLAGILLVVIAAIVIVAVRNPKTVKELKKIIKKEQEDEKPSDKKTIEETAVSAPVAPKAEEIVTTDKVEPVETESVYVEEAEEEDGGVVVDAKGNYFNIRYNKSFTAKLIQSSDDAKKYYGELKNEVLSYGKAKSRLSWAYDSVNAGRAPIVKFVVRGKTLCVYFPLNAAELNEKYKVETVDAAKYAAVPCMYRIKNERRLRYAKELIETVCASLGLTKKEAKNEDYYLPYETTEALIAKGLIKELTSAATSVQIERAKKDGAIRVVKQVSASEVNVMISNEIAASAIVNERKTARTGKKGTINVDTLSANFLAGDTVNIETLKAKKLIPASVGQVKLLARGHLDKVLHVELQDYSIDAVKMILATGGTVKRC